MRRFELKQKISIWVRTSWNHLLHIFFGSDVLHPASVRHRTTSMKPQRNRHSPFISGLYYHRNHEFCITESTFVKYMHSTLRVRPLWGPMQWVRVGSLCDCDLARMSLEISQLYCFFFKTLDEHKQALLCDSMLTLSCFSLKPASQSRCTHVPRMTPKKAVFCVFINQEYLARAIIHCLLCVLWFHIHVHYIPTTHSIISTSVYVSFISSHMSLVIMKIKFGDCIPCILSCTPYNPSFFQGDSLYLVLNHVCASNPSYARGGSVSA